MVYRRPPTFKLPAKSELPSRHDYSLLVRVLGELTGTAIIVGLGCMGCIENDSSPKAALQTGLTFGLIIMMVMQVFGFISGGHANPCVTISCYILGHLPWHNTILYILAQFLGAILGYRILMLLLPLNFIYDKEPGLCMTVPNRDISFEQAFGIEFVLTCVLIFGWCALWDVKNSKLLDSIALRVGLIATGLIMTGGRFTGASMNPARTLAPAIFLDNFEYIWLYFCSQLAAAIFMPIAWKLLYAPQSELSY